LEDLVFGGELEPGQALPSETELAAELGVSRLTVREAVKALEARGLVRTQHGRRPTVAQPNAAPLSGYFSAALRRDPGALLDLIEVRLALEVHAARLAATRGTRTSLSVLEMTLDAMRAAPDEAALNDADVRFHAALAAAGGNTMLTFLIEGMEDALSRSRPLSLRGHIARGRTVEDVIEQHATILAAVLAHDGPRAADAMREHLLQTKSDLRAALTPDQPQRD
jgi:GntR family transcriptional repressor for pyruvate dehydrogenase complex